MQQYCITHCIILEMASYVTAHRASGNTHDLKHATQDESATHTLHNCCKDDVSATMAT